MCMYREYIFLDCGGAVCNTRPTAGYAATYNGIDVLEYRGCLNPWTLNTEPLFPQRLNFVSQHDNMLCTINFANFTLNFSKPPVLCTAYVSAWYLADVTINAWNKYRVHDVQARLIWHLCKMDGTYHHWYDHLTNYFQATTNRINGIFNSLALLHA